MDSLYGIVGNGDGRVGGKEAGQGICRQVGAGSAGARIHASASGRGGGWHGADAWRGIQLPCASAGGAGGGVLRNGVGGAAVRFAVPTATGSWAAGARKRRTGPGGIAR